MKEAAGPDICWDHEGSVNPIALQEMTEEEKEVHMTRAISACKVIVINLGSLGFFHICQFALETPNTEPEQGWYAEQWERQPANLHHTVSEHHEQLSFHTSWHSTTRIWRRPLAKSFSFPD